MMSSSRLVIAINTSFYCSIIAIESKKSKSRRDVMQNNRKSGYGTQAMADGSGYKLSGSNGHYQKNSHQSKSRKSSHSYDHHGDGLQDGNVSRSKNSSPTPNNQRNEK